MRKGRFEPWRPEKNSMGWKLVFVLALVSGAALAALARRGAAQVEGRVEQEAVAQLNALREHLFRR